MSWAGSRQSPVVVQALGFAPEQRSSRAPDNWTMARFRPAPKTLKQDLESWRNCVFGHSVVASNTNAERVKADGAVYHRLKVISLGKMNNRQLKEAGDGRKSREGNRSRVEPD